MPREMNTPPGKNEKEEDLPNIGSDLNAKLSGKVKEALGIGGARNVSSGFRKAAQILN